MTSYQERYRPQFHFSAQQGWHNDPNGLVYYQGEYHLFFQHNPFGTEWGNMTWGHAVSTDLVHWQQLAHALLPDALGTMFSGSAVVDWRNTAGFQTGEEQALVAIYTAAGDTSPESEGKAFTQCLAYSNDRGRSWTKYHGNPVLPNMGKGNRDPKVVWHEPSQRWIMALFVSEDRYFAFFSSADLKTWTHLQDLEQEGTRECPDFFELPVTGQAGITKWVWMGANGRYLVGNFDGQRFTPETDLLVADWGSNYYAVQTFSDIPAEDGRRIQLAWMAGGDYPDMPFNQQMNFPNDITLKASPRGLRLIRQPVKEISQLYRYSHRLDNVRLEPSVNPLADVHADLLDIYLELDVATASGFRLDLRGFELSYHAGTKELRCLDKTALLVAENHALTLRVLVDRTSVEIFADEGETCMSFCFLAEHDDLTLTIMDGHATLKTLKLHELASIWPA